MALISIEYGSLASSDVLNSNFEYLDNKIASVSEAITAATAGIASSIASVNNIITQKCDIIRPIGEPIFRLDDTIFGDEIRLEGAEVSRTTYSALFEKYGVLYGSGDGVTTFNLPDYRDRTLWGASSFGYLDPTLPNITGTFYAEDQGTNANGAVVATRIRHGVHSGDGGAYRNLYSLRASLSSEIYKDDATVRPPSVAIRVVTRYR